MEKVVIASDSFKGSASSKLVAECLSKGIRRVEDSLEITAFSIADGGEGTVESLVEALGGTYHTVEVRGPYKDKVRAVFGILNESEAVIEMAQASGLQFKTLEDLPENATTYGTGELIKAALDQGATRLYIGLGGSATNDGGAGMAQALGVKLLDKAGEEIGTGIKELSRLHTVDYSQVDPRIHQCTVTILSDVTNPLTGENGATAVFGPQKGISSCEVREIDEILRRFADIVESKLEGSWQNLNGAGAAGGLGFGLMAFCQADMTSGIEKVLELIQLEKVLAQADLVITGEGRMDGQSIQGKAPVGIARLAKKYELPVIAVVGGRDDDVSKMYEAGIDMIISIVNRPMPLQEAIDHAEMLLIEAGETVIRAVQLQKR